jgi:hypothetical protein
MTINPFNTTHFGWIDAYLGKASDKVLADSKASTLQGDQKASTLQGKVLADSKASTPKGDQKASFPLGSKVEPPICEAYTLRICDTLRICEAYTPTTVPRILRTIADEWKSDKFHIQILNVCDKRFKDPVNKREYYNQYRWIMCGGFFLTAIDVGITILSRLKEIFVETTQAGYGHGEEMFYLEVLDEYSDQIRGTYGDYGQILDNFIYPTQNIEYVYHTIFERYKQYGYTREAKALATQLIEAADKSWVIINDDTYTELSRYNRSK